VGPLDGAPLDRPLEAVLVGILLPLIWVLHPAFLRQRTAKVAVLSLLAWKVATAAALTQGGWCAEFLIPYPANEAYRFDRSWDLRSYTGGSPPECSAVVARALPTLSDFPAWILNVTFDRDYSLGRQDPPWPAVPPLPPSGRYRMIVTGWIRPTAAGRLSVDLGDDMEVDATLDALPLHRPDGRRLEADVPAGDHELTMALDLNGERWRFVPLWDGGDLFTAIPTGLRRGTILDRSVRPWMRYITPSVVVLLLGAWIASALRAFGPNPATAWWVIAWLIAALGLSGASDTLIRVSVVGLLAAAALPVPDRLKTWRGALLLVGVPCLAILAARSMPHVGRFTIFSQGDDWQVFQRTAFRIFIQGYWLEGGETTFWFQPFYRWTTGALHLVWGDSSVGDLYWDIDGLLVGAIFAYQVTNRVAGFRAGIAAAAISLATVAVGPNWYMIGRGLSEISASAWLFLAALALMRSRDGSFAYAILAGASATLAFYTRLNHLPLAIALVAFTVPDDFLTESWPRLGALWSSVPKGQALLYLATFALGMCGFAWRNWFYTGTFSIVAGSALYYNGTGVGIMQGWLSSGYVWRRALESVAMIATVQDPPRFDPRAIFVIGGVACALLALVRVPIVRRLPLHLVIACLAAIAGGLVARGLAYPGRFSLHLIPLAVAASTASLALALSAGRGVGEGPRSTAESLLEHV
jgi:hypothetical protein